MRLVILTQRIFGLEIGRNTTGQAMKLFLAYISAVLNRLETYLGVTAQRSDQDTRHRQDIIVISAVMLVVLVLFLLAAYLITRF